MDIPRGADTRSEYPRCTTRSRMALRIGYCSSLALSRSPSSGGGRRVLHFFRRSGIRVATQPLCARGRPRFDRPVPPARVGHATAGHDAFLAAVCRATRGTNFVRYLPSRQPLERMIHEESSRDSEREEGEARFAVRRESRGDHKGHHEAREESPFRNYLHEHDEESQREKEDDQPVEGRQGEVGEERHPPSTDASTLLNIMETRESYAGRGPLHRAPGRSSRAG